MEPNNHNKKLSITEEDVCNLLQRYTAATVLTLLKETAQIVDVKLDWNELVKKTDTGIKNAREYQMLWRHLAYRQPLLDNLTAQDQPLDDDSDLEYELEACPPASDADAMEASNCVKILTSGSTNKSRMPNSSVFEVPKVSLGNPHVPKQSQAVGPSGDGLDTSGFTSNNQKKRKLCTEEEDPDRVAPNKKGEIKSEKNSTQRAQRANVIRKKQGTGGANAPLTEAQLATRYALDMALKDGPTTGVGNGHAGPLNPAKVSASKRNLPVNKVTAQSSQLLPSSVTGGASSGKPVAIASSSKLCPQKKAPPQSSVSQESIQAAAVAAGARIASPSDAACLLKAAQSKNAVHIRGGGPLVKTSAANISNSLPPNVHFIGKTTPPTSVAAGTASIAVGSQQAKVSAVVSTVAPGSQLPKVKTTSSVAMDHIPQQVENRISSATNVQGSDAIPMTRIQEDSASVSQWLPKAALVKPQAPSLGADVGPSKEANVSNSRGADVGPSKEANVSNSRGAVNKDVAENEGKSDPCKQVIENPLPKNDNEQPHAVHRSCIPCVNGTQGVSPKAIVDGGTEKIEVSSGGVAGAKDT